jgi:Flp pilus assembly protein TadG
MEFAIVMPLVLLLVLGVVEVGYALLDQQVVTKLTREGSNLISRDSSLQDATTALRTMATRPVDFANGSLVIFSVLKKGATPNTANYRQIILYQRTSYGTGSGSSRLVTSGGSFRGAPDYEAINSDSDTRLRVTNVPNTLITVEGGLMYVTEIYTRHTLITPFDRFGALLPNNLYSIAYF